MSLEDTQIAERYKIQRLLEVLDRNGATWEAMKRAIEAAMAWGSGDLTPHIREAIRHYLGHNRGVNKYAIVCARLATQITEWQAAKYLEMGIVEYRELEDSLITAGTQEINQQHSAAHSDMSRCGRLTPCGSPHCQCRNPA